MNIVLLWLELLDSATPEAVAKVIAHYTARPQTPNCPTVILFGQAKSDGLYTDPKYRPALDAWDVGKVNSYDIVRWAKQLTGVANGNGAKQGNGKGHHGKTA